jgi:hypothetical protein
MWERELEKCEREIEFLIAAETERGREDYKRIKKEFTC